MLRYIKNHTIYVFKFCLCIDARIFRQFHKKLSASLFNSLGDNFFVFDNKSEMMQAGPIMAINHTALTAWKIEESKVHHSVGKTDRVANGTFRITHSLHFENGFIELGSLLQVRNLHSYMA